jgi:hypothetical protein
VTSIIFNRQLLDRLTSKMIDMAMTDHNSIRADGLFKDGCTNELMNKQENKYLNEEMDDGERARIDIS